MSAPFVDPLSAPGVPLLMLRTIRRATRHHQMIADLKTVGTLCCLPHVDWAGDRYGIVGTVRGTDEHIAATVRMWAEMFEAKAMVVVPERRIGMKGEFDEPGFATAHLFPWCTVAGRLVEPKRVGW
jgi:hypothetical protein